MQTARDQQGRFYRVFSHFPSFFRTVLPAVPPIQQHRAKAESAVWENLITSDGCRLFSVGEGFVNVCEACGPVAPFFDGGRTRQQARSRAGDGRGQGTRRRPGAAVHSVCAGPAGASRGGRVVRVTDPGRPVGVGAPGTATTPPKRGERGGGGDAETLAGRGFSRQPRQPRRRGDGSEGEQAAPLHAHERGHPDHNVVGQAFAWGCFVDGATHDFGEY